MSAADFDDIFGEDPKMDATAAPTLTDVNLEDEFGGNTSGKAAKPTDISSAQGSNWEHIGSREQDEFLSWLDDGKNEPTETPNIPEPPASLDNIPPAPVSTTPAEFDSVSLDDDNDEFDKMLEGTSSAVPSVNEPSFGDSDDLDRMLDGANTHPNSFESTQTPTATVNGIASNTCNELGTMMQATNAPVATSSAISLDDDDDLEQIVKSAGASTFVPVAPVGNISLDDDDDDLEKIIQQANKQANASSSRENSSSSLQIKSQVQAQHKPQIGTKWLLLHLE